MIVINCQEKYIHVIYTINIKEYEILKYLIQEVSVMEKFIEHTTSLNWSKIIKNYTRTMKIFPLIYPKQCIINFVFFLSHILNTIPGNTHQVIKV